MKVLEGKVIEIELEFLIDGLTTKIILKGDTSSAIKRSLLKKISDHRANGYRNKFFPYCYETETMKNSCK